MRRGLFFTAIALLLSGTPPLAARQPLYQIIDAIPGPDGFYDYISVDDVRARVFVGRSTGVTVIDIGKRAILAGFPSGEAMAAILPVPSTSRVVSTNPEKAKVTVFDQRSGRIMAHIPAGQDPDGAAYDPVSQHVFVMNGESGDISVIDPIAAKNLATIKLNGRPEAAIADGRGRLFVNLEDKAEIAVIDVRRRAVITRYPLGACVEPTGITYDPASQLLVTVCHNGLAMLIDARSGKERGSFAIGKGADGVIFDAARRLIFVPCDDGTLVIASLDRKGIATQVQTVATQEGARTAALDPRTGRLYLPVSAFVTNPDGSRRENADGWWERVPGTFKVLVVAPR